MPRRSATQHELTRIELLAGLPGETARAARAAHGARGGRPGHGRSCARASTDDRFYVVLSGMLAVSQRDLGARSVLRPGDYFGEVAASDGRAAHGDGVRDDPGGRRELRPGDVRRAPAAALRRRRLERLGEHRVAERRPRLLRPVAEPPVGEDAAREAGCRDRPRGRCRCGRSGRTCAAELREPVQCGDFPSRSSKVRPQSFGSIRPRPGRTPVRPGNWTVAASASVSAATSVGCRSSRPSASRSSSGPRYAWAGEPSRRPARPSGCGDRLREVVGERHLRPLLRAARPRRSMPVFE